MKTTSAWHISPLADTLAYHASWLLVLVPLTWNAQPGYLHPVGMVVMFLSVTVTFVHRHFSLPYAYLDAGAFRAHRTRLLCAAGALTAACAITPGFLASTPLFPAIVFFSALWNIWHVVMQKFGILRLYAAKTGGASARLDRFFLWSWVPLFFFYLAPKYEALVLENGRSIAVLTAPVIGFLRFSQPVTLPVSVAVAAAATALFLRAERAEGRWRSPARLTLAAGMFGLYASFLFLDPVHVYLAFGFNHAVEYMVFVGAFLGAKYRVPRAGILARAMRYPRVSFAAFFFTVGAAYLAAYTWGSLVFPGAPLPVFFGRTIGEWLFYWTVYQSLMHFYLDGFLWKLRIPEVAGPLLGKPVADPIPLDTAPAA